MNKEKQVFYRLRSRDGLCSEIMPLHGAPRDIQTALRVKMGADFWEVSESPGCNRTLETRRYRAGTPRTVLLVEYEEEE